MLLLPVTVFLSIKLSSSLSTTCVYMLFGSSVIVIITFYLPCCHDVQASSSLSTTCVCVLFGSSVILSVTFYLPCCHGVQTASLCVACIKVTVSLHFYRTYYFLFYAFIFSSIHAKVTRYKSDFFNCIKEYVGS